jgi:hypothetical protein
MIAFREMLGMPGMLRSIHKIFSKIPDPKIFANSPGISIADHLMSGLAVFGLKCPSLLDYDKKRGNKITAQNLRDLYLVSNPPSDTYLRERLDDVNPNFLRPTFKKIFAHFQRGKGLEEFVFYNGHVLISGDGLTSNAPYIRIVEMFRLKYILIRGVGLILALTESYSRI